MTKNPDTKGENVYGKNCGYGAEAPPMRIRMNKLIEAKDTTELSQWLWSQDPASICYAIEGLRKLQSSGTSLTNRQQVQLRKLEGSNLLVNTCKGCIFELQPMKEALADPLLGDQ